VWKPFVDFVTASPKDYSFAMPLTVVALPAQHFWDAAFLTKNAPQVIRHDDRTDAPEGNVFWAGNLEETGWFLHAYQSTWLPAALLAPDRQVGLADALYASSRHRGVGLHLNKGLAGAPDAEVAAARDTATNPAATEAFALAISAAYGPPAFAGIAGHEPDMAAAKRNSAAVEAAMAELRKLAPNGGAYVSESNYFQKDWQQAFWGANYQKLRAVKDKYDPDGLFFVHHGVGSEDWSADGFMRG
jgi:FAD/FMN-containing dehydrogenase